MPAAPRLPTPVRHRRYPWTPDLQLGPIRHEIERVLHAAHLGFRTTGLASSALTIISRPEDIAHPVGAWAAWLGECADAVVFWRGTRLWKSLVDPRVNEFDLLLGTAAGALGTASMTATSQIDGTAWTDRMLTLRVATLPASGRTLRATALAGVTQFLPNLAKLPPGSRVRAGIGVVTPVARAFAQSWIISARMRARADAADARRRDTAGPLLVRALAAERASFETDVLGPAASALVAIRGSLSVGDRVEAERIALPEATRLRAWLRLPTTVGPPDDGLASARLAEVDRSVARLAMRVQGAVRLASSAVDVLELIRGATRHHSATRLATALMAARAATGAALLVRDAAGRDLDARWRLLVGAVDVASIAALGAHQHVQGHDAPTVAWIQRSVYEASALSGATGGPQREVRAVRNVLAAVRAGTAACDRRPAHQRIAASLNEVVIVQGTARQIERVRENSLNDARRWAGADESVPPELEALRLEHRTFVHDGVAQVLDAVRGGLYEAPTMVRWIDDELARVRAEAPPHSIRHGLDQLAVEFATRGLAVDVVVPEPLPAWTDAPAAIVSSIFREGLNNVVKHTMTQSCVCAAEVRRDGSVIIAVADDGPRQDHAACGERADPSDGAGSETTGRRTMADLAAGIGAELTWVPNAGGGTTVTLALGHDRDPREADCADVSAKR